MSRLLIVGIGASAGGLSAMKDLLSIASCHHSMCFVIVSHLPRFLTTDLPEILANVSKLKTFKIVDGLKPEHCGLYVIPPNRYVEFKNGRFVTAARPEEGPNQSADVFFESLARCCGKNAIGVILSGAGVGRDGSNGLKAIKKAGGHTYAQLPSEAQFKDMPELAIETGCVDSVLPAAAIGHDLSLLSWVEATGDRTTEV